MTTSDPFLTEPGVKQQKALREQLDLALDNLSESNAILHKIRQNQTELENQLSDVRMENAALEHEAACANEQVTAAEERLVDAKDKQRGLQSQIDALRSENLTINKELEKASEYEDAARRKKDEYEKKTEALQKMYTDLAAQMQDLKDEFSRCTIQEFADICIQNLTATIDRLNQLEEVADGAKKLHGAHSSVVLEARLQRAKFVLPSRQRDDDLKIGDLDATEHAMLSRNAGAGTDFNSAARIQQLEMQLKWQQTAGDEVAIELGGTTKLLQERDNEITRLTKLLRIAPLTNTAWSLQMAHSTTISLSSDDNEALQHDTGLLETRENFGANMSRKSSTRVP